jgi:hypothetical protein
MNDVSLDIYFFISDFDKLRLNLKDDYIFNIIPKRNRPTTYSTNAPCHVSMWNIICLNRFHKGMFYYLCLLPDLFDRNG